MSQRSTWKAGYANVYNFTIQTSTHTFSCNVMCKRIEIIEIYKPILLTNFNTKQLTSIRSSKTNCVRPLYIMLISTPYLDSKFSENSKLICSS